jgi:glutamine amidotransferase
MKVTVADLDVGNLHSLRKALERLGATVDVTADAARWLDAEVLVLPGDGAFGTVVKQMEVCKRNLRQRVQKNPTLGICIGMQLFFEESEEAPGVQGLGLLPEVIRKLPAQRLPHMGWNTVEPDGSQLFAEIPQQTYFYFVHSYGALASDSAIAWTDYEGKIVAAVQIGPWSYGVQFHPEKSGRWGLKLLKNFLELAEET